MIIPPITLYEEDQALIEILKALAQKGAALSDYTGVEAKKIQALVECLENQRAPALANGELVESLHASLCSLENVRIIQTVLESNLKSTLKQLGAEDLYRLVSLPPGKNCRITAQGQGLVMNEQDSFYLGSAQLKEAALSANDAAEMCGKIKYRVELNGHFEELESVSSEMRLAFVGPVLRRACPSRPNIAWITGYGIAKKSATADECAHGIAWFSLTLWDYGSRKKKGKFRMAICNPHHSSLNHDSGIITQ